MSASRTKNIAIGLGVGVLWGVFSPALFAGVQSLLSWLGLPSPVVVLIMTILPIVLFTEVLIKLLFLSSLRPKKFTPTDLSAWTSLDLAKFDRSTQELEELGFFQLGDFTSGSIKGAVRLFVHPQKLLFAEIAQTDRIPNFCNMSCLLDKHWSLGVTNLNLGASFNATSYAFMRQPRVLSKRFANFPIDALFQSISTWQQTAAIELNATPLTEISSDFYFEQMRLRMLSIRQDLVKKSITWGLLEMFWYWWIAPQDEWWGDYHKFAKQG